MILKIKISWDKAGVKKDSITEASVFYYGKNHTVIGSYRLFVELPDNGGIILSHKPSKGCKYLPPALEVSEVRDTVESLAKTFVSGCNFSNPLVKDIDVIHWLPHNLKGVKSNDDELCESDVKCPHCSTRDFIPSVVYANVENYGSKVLNFRCIKCNKCVRIMGRRAAVFSEPQKSVESDF